MAVSRQVQRSEGEEKEAGIKPRYIQGRNIQGKTIIRAEPRLNGLGAVTSHRPGLPDALRRQGCAQHVPNSLQ